LDYDKYKENKKRDLDKKEKVFITHANCIEDAEFLKSLIQETYNLDVIVSFIGPVVGGHTSSGCLALFFETNDRRDSEDPKQFELL